VSGSIHRLFLVVSGVVVAGAVAYGFVIVGSPEQRRLERLDERRLEDLQAIHAEIQDLVRDPDDASTMRRALPATLEELAGQARWRKLTLADPETGAPYGYRVISGSVFEVSATFDLPRDAQHGVFWNHPAGRHAWRIDALDPP
jgi:hypothetical protein